MPYLSQILGTQVFDAAGEKIGAVSDLGAAVGEVFPRVTALAFKGPAKVPFMISWRKYVKECTPDRITLNVDATEVRFSYLQQNELLLQRDLMNKQIVDTQGMKVVRVNDLKLSRTGDGEFRLLGAEVGARGILRGIAPGLERVVCASAKALGKPIPERIIAWSYMDLLDRDLSQVKLSVTHKSLEDMHPADIADIIEQLDPKLRAQVFSQLDTANAAQAMSELEDEYQADVIDDLPERQASAMIAQMDPDDAADIIGALSYEKAEKLLNLMGVKEEKAIRQLLGYPRDTAGGIMTSEFVAMPESATVGDAKKRIAGLDEDFENVFYVYTLDGAGRLTGVVSMRDLVVNPDGSRLADVAFTDALITVSPEDDQTTVADEMNKYSLVDVPVVNEDGKLLGIVTVDDALGVMADEHERELELASGTRGEGASGDNSSKLAWFLRRELWFGAWIALGALLCHVLPASIGMAVLVFLPIVLLVADDMAVFASSYLMDDDEPPSLVGLVVRNLFTGLAMGALGWLLVSCAVWTNSVPAGFDHNLAIATVSAAMATVALLVALTAPYTKFIEKLMDEGKPTPGTTAALLCMLVGAGLFVGLTFAFAAGMGAL